MIILIYLVWKKVKPSCEKEDKKTREKLFVGQEHLIKDGDKVPKKRFNSENGKLLVVALLMLGGKREWL